MEHNKKCRIISFADKLLSILIDQKCNEIEMVDLLSKWKLKYNSDLNPILLSTFPFLKIIKYDNDQENSAHIVVNIEQDDCCNFCRFENCKLIHIIGDKDAFCTEFAQTRHCSNCATCNKFHRPNVKVIQRLIDCFTHSASIQNNGKTSSLHLSEIIAIHNQLYPSFITHCPNSHNIKLRYRSKFYIQNQASIGNDNNETAEDDLIVEWKSFYNSNQMKQFNPTMLTNQRFRRSTNSISSLDPMKLNFNNTLYNSDAMYMIIPEQTELYKLRIGLNSEWDDKHLISDLLHYVRKHSEIGLKDIYIPRRYRTGFLSFKNSEKANRFIERSLQQKIKCGGRTIRAKVWHLKGAKSKILKENAIRISISNLNQCLSYPEFTFWCYENVGTAEEISDMQLINCKVTRGADYGIFCFANRQDAKQIMLQLNGKRFRDSTLKLSHWVHPNKLNPNICTANNRLSTSSNSLSSLSSLSKLSRCSSSNSVSNSCYTNDNGSDIDFKERATRSRLFNRHTLKSSDLRSNVNCVGSVLSSVAIAGSEMKAQTVELSFEDWLVNVVKCGEYLELFIQNGFDAMDLMDSQFVDHKVLNEIGIQKIGHRVKILKAIDNYQNQKK